MSDTYDAFLFESLGVEENGMDLSVLSALARAGVDPWAEAGRLAALPRQAAVAAITALLGLAGDTPLARRLADLLPRSAVPQTTLSNIADRRALIRKHGLVIVAVWLAILIGYVGITSNTHPAQPAPADAHALVIH